MLIKAASVGEIDDVRITHAKAWELYKRAIHTSIHAPQIANKCTSWLCCLIGRDQVVCERSWREAWAKSGAKESRCIICKALCNATRSSRARNKHSICFTQFSLALCPVVVSLSS